MIKKIFIYWSQSFKKAPLVVNRCLLNWKLKNPNWQIVVLDDSNLAQYINIEEEIPRIRQKKFSKTAYSDIIRIFLLAKYGGCWVDATTFVTKSLDAWLPPLIKSGFFAYNKPGPDRLVSSWFMYSEKDNYLVKKWKEATIGYWNKNDKIHHYFWFHYLFTEIYGKDLECKKLWDSTSKVTAFHPMNLGFKGLLNNIHPEIKKDIDNKITPIHKLTYKYQDNKYTKDCNLDYILNSFKVFLIGFNKTGIHHIHNMFTSESYKSYHYGRWTGDWVKKKEIELNKSIIHDNFILSNGERHDFKYLDQKYVNSFFILQTRKLDEWIDVRLRWIKNHYPHLPTHPFNKCFHEPRSELIKEFVCKRNVYYQKVFQYFKIESPARLNQHIHPNFMFCDIYQNNIISKLFNLNKNYEIKKEINPEYLDLIHNTFTEIGISRADFESYGIVKTNLSEEETNYFVNIRREWG